MDDLIQDIEDQQALCKEKQAALKRAVGYALHNYNKSWNPSHFEKLCIEAGVYPYPGKVQEECLRLEGVLRYAISCHNYIIDGSTLYDLYEGKEDKRT